MKVSDPAPADVDDVEAFVVVRLAGLRTDVAEPFHTDHDVPGWPRDRHPPDVKAQLVVEAEQALEPRAHGVAAVALAAEGRFAGEYVVDVIGHASEGNLIIPAAQRVEDLGNASPDEGAIHGANLP
jgi:hypothetical protein